MVLKEGDFARINYTGKIKDTDEVFDTTIEKVAKEKGIYTDGMKFKPTPLVAGAGHVIKGLDEALIGMDVGESKTVAIPPEKGYGQRDPKLVQLIPLKEFKKQGLTPVPGLRFESEGRIGKIQSVSGGRVRVDFNYELAGKTLEYTVTVEEKENKLEEKIRLLLEMHFPYADPNEQEISIADSKATIVLSKAASMRREAPFGKHLLARDIFRFLDKMEEVEFKEVYKRERKEEAAKAPAKKEEKEAAGEEKAKAEKKEAAAKEQK